MRLGARGAAAFERRAHVDAVRREPAADPTPHLAGTDQPMRRYAAFSCMTVCCRESTIPHLPDGGGRARSAFGEGREHRRIDRDVGVGRGHFSAYVRMSIVACCCVTTSAEPTAV